MITTDLETPIKVLIVDDHPMFRSGLRDALGADLKINCVGECGTATEVMMMVGRLEPDIILMDIHLQNRMGVRTSGIDLTRQIKQKWPEVEVLMLSALDAPSVVRDALKAGASGYLSKDADKKEIISAIEQALNDCMPISPSINKALFQEQFPKNTANGSDTVGEPPKHLISVMVLLADGLSNDEIWVRLKKERGDAQLQRKTIRNYIYNIVQWLGAMDRRDAITRLRSMGYGRNMTMII